MKLIVGLGNPGRIYAGSRHNIGFSVVKSLAKKCRFSFRRDPRTFSLSVKGRREGEDIVLAMPQAFMNVSGQAVGALCKKHRIDIENMLVVCDDMDLEFGRLRIRPKGSSGGHRGLVSIIGVLGENTFCRLRIGIGRPSQALDAAGFVLSPFTKQERAELDGVIDAAADCCLSWATRGIAETMNIYNKRSQVNE